MITLYYPYDPPYTRTATLRNPILGDSRQLNLKTQIQQNMEGFIYTHVKTLTNNKLVLTFECLTRLKSITLRSFWESVLGYEFKYVDPVGVSWKVRMGNETMVITTNRDGCSYDATIELLTV